MTRCQGLCCGSGPWLYSAPSSYAALAPVNCKSGRVVSITFQSYLFPRSCRIRGQLSEAARSGDGHSAEAVSAVHPPLTPLNLQTQTISRQLGASITDTRPGAVLVGQRGRARQGGQCIQAADTPSAGKHLEGLTDQDAARQKLSLVYGTTIVSVVDAVATDVGAAPAGSDPGAPWRNVNVSSSGNGIGITHEPDGASGCSSTTADGLVGCSQPGDAGRGNIVAASHDNGLACGGKGLRQGNWRVGWWDIYEREVQAAARESVVRLTSVREVESAAGAAPRPERMEPTRHRTGAVNAVLSRHGDVSADASIEKNPVATGFNGPAVKRRDPDNGEKPGKEAGRARFPRAVEGKATFPEIREAPAPALKATAVATATAAGVATAYGSIKEGQQVRTGFSAEHDPVLSDITGQGSTAGRGLLHAGSSTASTAKRVVATTTSTATLGATVAIGATAAAEAEAADAKSVAKVDEHLADPYPDEGYNVDGGRDEGPDVIPPFLDPDQERGRLSASRIEALYYIRALVLQRVTASADVRLLADALDWCVPLMDLKAVREAFRMIRTASVSVAFPRNSQLMPRPRFLSSFHFVARRLHCLLEVYGTGVMDWPFLLCVAGGMSAGRIRNRELMLILHDRGLEMLRQSEEARQRWEAAVEGEGQQQQQQQQQGGIVAAVTEAGTAEEETAGMIVEAWGEAGLAAAGAVDRPSEHTPGGSGATSANPDDTQTRSYSGVGGAGRAVEAASVGVDASEDEVQGKDAASDVPSGEGIGSSLGGGQIGQTHSRGRRATKAAHLPIIGIRDLVCRFLLPLHHLGQPIDPECLQLLEGMLARDVPLQAPDEPAVAADTAAEDVLRGRLSVAQSNVSEAVGECDGIICFSSVSNQLQREALKLPPKLWLLRDVLELYSLVDAPPSPVLLRGIQEGCIAAAAALRAAAAMEATPGAADAGRNGSWRSVTDGDEEDCYSNSKVSDRSEAAGRAMHDGERNSGGGVERTRRTALKAVKRPRTWARAAHALGSTIPVAPATVGDDTGSDVQRDYEVLAGTVASVLYLLSRVVRRNRGGGSYGRGGAVNAVGTEDSSFGTSHSPSAGFGQSPWDLAWAHDALEALVPWMHTLTPLQLSGMLRTVVWLGAADRFLLPPPRQLQLPSDQAQTLGPPSGNGGATASAAVTAQRQQRQQQHARPAAFLESYFLALSCAVSEQPTAGTVTIGNIVEAAVGVAAAGVAAYGVPPEARDLYAKLLFRANVIMAYQATQRNGFLPPYALNLVPALAAAVRDAGSAAAVPAKLVAENLRLSERLLSGWHADGLAQVVAALETMNWVAPPGGWIDSLYAAIGQRLHANQHMVTAADNSLVSAINGSSLLANPRPAPDRHNGNSDTAAAGVLPFPPPRQPDFLGPTSLIALLRAARHLARVASPRREAAGAAAAVADTATAGVTAGSVGGTAALAMPAAEPVPAATADIAPSSAPPCGVMPEPLARCLAARLGHMLAEGEGLHGEDMMDLIMLCQRGALSSPAPATSVMERCMTCSSSRGSSGNSSDRNSDSRVGRGQGIIEAGPSMMLALGDVTGLEGVAAHGGSLALMLLDALAEGSTSLTLVAPDLATPEDSVYPDPSSRDRGSNSCGRNNSKTSSRLPAPPSGGSGGPEAAAALAEARTRHIILSALEQALALQLRCQHSAVAARGIVALSRSLEQVLGRAPGPEWWTAVQVYLGARCDAALAEVRLRSEVAAATSAASPLRPHVAAFGVVQSAVDLLDAPVAAAGVGSVYSASALGPGWWREVSYSAGVCIDYFRKARGSSRPWAFKKGGVSATSATTVAVATTAWAPASTLAPPQPLPLPPPAAHAASLPKSVQSTDQQLSSDIPKTPDLEQALDLMIRYGQHLGRWLAANRVADPGLPAEATVPSEVAKLSLQFSPSTQIQEQPQHQRPPQVAGLLRPHIYFLTGLFSLLQPLLLPLPARPSMSSSAADASLAAAQAWTVLRHGKDHQSRRRRSLVRPSRSSPAATISSACAVAAAPAGLGHTAYDTATGGHGGTASQAAVTVSASQLVRLAELLACSRFKPLRFPSLLDWPKAYLARVESQLPLLSSVDACMVVRALSCQGWRPQPQLMDLLLDRVLADGGLVRVRTVYGPASLVQMLSWLAYARFLPGADWMETLLGELGPYLDSIARGISGSGSRPLRLGSCSGGSSCRIDSSGRTCTINNSVEDHESLQEFVLKGSSSPEEYSSITVDKGVSNRNSGDGSSYVTISSMSSSTSTCNSGMISSGDSRTGNVPADINFGLICSSSSMHCSGSSFRSKIQNTFRNGTGYRLTMSSEGGHRGDDVLDSCSDATCRIQGSYGSARTTSSTSCDFSATRSGDNPDGDGNVSRFVGVRQPDVAAENKETVPAAAPSALHNQATDVASITAASVEADTTIAAAPYTAPHRGAQAALPVRQDEGNVHATDSSSLCSGSHPDASGIDNPASGTGDVSEDSTNRASSATGSTRNMNISSSSSSSTGGSTASDLGLEELCVLGSALAELRYRPERLWLHRALAAGGAAAVAASAAVAGMDVVGRDGAPIDHVRGGRDGHMAERRPVPAGPECSPSRLASKLAALLWRWAAVAATPGDAPAAAVASVELFAGEMVAATGPLLSVMGPSDLVRCAEGMAALQQLMVRQRGGGGSSGNDSRSHSSASLAATVSVTSADMRRAAATYGAGGLLSMRTWWLQLERSSANVLLTRPSTQPSASSPTWQQQRPEPQLKPYNLSVMLRCIAAAGHMPSSAWLQRYCQHTLPLLPSYKAQDVAVTMWAFAHMRLSLGAYNNTTSSVHVVQSAAAPPRVSPRAQAGNCLHPLAGRISSDSCNSDGGGNGGCSGGAGANPLAYQLQRQLGALPEPLQPLSPSPVPYGSFAVERPDNSRLSGYRQRPGSQQSQVEPREPAVRLRAPPALGSWMEAAVGMLPPLLRHCTSADLQNITWALVTLDFPPPSGWLRQYELATQPRLPYLSGAALLYSLWAYGKFGHAPSDPYMEAALQALRRGLLGTDPYMPAAPQGSSSSPSSPRASPHNPEAVVTAAPNSIDTLFHSPTQPPANGDNPGSGKAGGTVDTGARGGRCGVVERLDAQSLALLLHSLAQLDYLPAEWWMTEYLQAVLKELPSMSAMGLAILLRAVATLQVYPTKLWLDTVLDTAAYQLPHFSDQQLESFLSALADLMPRAPPSLTQLQRFMWACLRVAPDNRKVGAYYRLLAAYFPAPAPTQVPAATSTIIAPMAIAREKAARPLVPAPSGVVLAADQVPSQQVHGRAFQRLPHVPGQSSSPAAVAALLPCSARVSDRYDRSRNWPLPSARTPAPAVAIGEAAAAPIPRLTPRASTPVTLGPPSREDSAHEGGCDGEVRPYALQLGRRCVRPVRKTVRPRRQGAGAAAARPPRGCTVPQQLQMTPPEAASMAAAAATERMEIPERPPD